MNSFKRLLLAVAVLAAPALYVPAAKADNFSVSFGTPGSNVYYANHHPYRYGYRPPVYYAPPVAYYAPRYYAPPQRVVVVNRDWNRGWRGHHQHNHWDRGPHRGHGYHGHGGWHR